VKNKKALFGIMGLVYLVFIIIILALLVWFGFKINGAIIAYVDFIRKYWKWLLISTTLLLFYKQIQAILNFILSKIGINVK
jgi:hypothetical protein